jgi:hypothetical protein
MGDVNQNIEYSKESHLENLIDEEIHREPEKGFINRIKNNIERIIWHNEKKILIPISLAVGGLSWYLAKKTTESTAYLFKQFGRDDIFKRISNLPSPVVLGMLLSAAAYLVSGNMIRSWAGHKICDLKNSSIHIKKSKNNFIYKHRLGLALLTGAAFIGYTAIKAYHQIDYLSPEAIGKILIKNSDKAIYPLGVWTASALGSFYFLYNQIGGFFSIKKKDTFRNAYGLVLHHLSKKAGLHFFEKQSKKGNLGAKEFLSRVTRNIEDKLELRKQVIDEQKKDPLYYGEEISWVRPLVIGTDYFSFRKKKEPNIIIDIVMKLYYVNPSRAIKIFDNLVRKVSPKEKPGIIATRNYFLNIHEDDNKECWHELRYWLEKEGKLKLIPGSEGRFSSFMDEFTNKLFIFKDYMIDKSDKFFIETAIKEILKDTGVIVETPLFFYDEENLQKHIFIRDGVKNMREKLEQSSTIEKGEFFEKIIPLLSKYQEMIQTALEKQSDEFILNSEFRGETRRIVIPILDLEKNLMRRAFIGSRQGELRLGMNEYLPPFILKIKEYDQLNHYIPILTFNHGDAVTTNITETLCIIDPRPRIAHPLYDFTYISCDPAFLPINLDSRKEKILEILLKKDDFRGKEEGFVRAFNSLYLHNCLCLSGANLYLGNKEVAGFILNELLDFSKARPFEKELLIYLKHSYAKDLLKSL